MTTKTIQRAASAAGYLCVWRRHSVWNINQWMRTHIKKMKNKSKNESRLPTQSAIHCPVFGGGESGRIRKRTGEWAIEAKRRHAAVQNRTTNFHVHFVIGPLCSSSIASPHSFPEITDPFHNSPPKITCTIEIRSYKFSHSHENLELVLNCDLHKHLLGCGNSSRFKHDRSILNWFLRKLYFKILGTCPFSATYFLGTHQSVESVEWKTRTKP